MQAVCRKFMDVDQSNTSKDAIWYTHGLTRAKDHSTDWYFCSVKTSGFNKKNKSKIEYPNNPSAIRSMPRSAEILLPVFKQLPHREDLNDAENSVTAIMQILTFTWIQFVVDFISTS